MTARTILIPAPRAMSSLSATGPTAPMSARSADGARQALFNALSLGADDEDDEQGWCVWWASPASAAGDVVRVDLWLNDDSGGRRSLEAVRARLEAGAFLVHVSGRPNAPEAVQRGERPLHARLRGARIGTLFGDLSMPVQVMADLTEVQVPPRWEWPVQACPSCGHRGHPMERINGFPTVEGKLAIGLGEAVFGGCCIDDDEEDFDVECAACEVGFHPRRR